MLLRSPGHLGAGAAAWRQRGGRRPQVCARPGLRFRVPPAHSEEVTVRATQRGSHIDVGGACAASQYTAALPCHCAPEQPRTLVFKAIN